MGVALIGMRSLRLLLALLFCLQSSLAMAHCARLGAASPSADQPFLVVICTSQGLVTVDMSSPDDRQDAPPKAMADFCLACHVLPSIDLPAPATLSTPVLLPDVVDYVSRHPVRPVGARAPPYHPTGPPLNA